MIFTFSPIRQLEIRTEKPTVTNVCVSDLQMGEVSLLAVHLDKVALGLGHY